MTSRPNSHPADFVPPTITAPPGPPDPALVHQVASALKSGGIVAMRTDTVYGLLASVNRPDALARLVDLKDRPAAKPFVVLTADWLGVRQVTSHLPAVARQVGSKYWPGPVTLVLPAAPDLPAEILGSGGTIAVRIPHDALLLAVLRELRCPVAAPSANRAGEAPTPTAAETLHVFGAGIDLVVDGGPAQSGLPSTIVRCDGARGEVLREGAAVISPGDLEP
jgi:L-threonylcarbamoyladenylate synthase